MRRIGTLCAVALAAVLFSTATVPAFAADDKAEVVSYRQNVMKLISGHMKAIKAVAKGQVSYTDQVAGNAHAIAELAKAIPAVFPAGTGADMVKSRAKPEIWADWAKFQAAAKNLADEATQMAAVAKGGDVGAIGKQLGSLGKNGCGGCHKPFRAPKKKK